MDHRRRLKLKLIFIALIVVTFFIFVINLSLGSVTLAFGDVLQSLFGGGDRGTSLIVMKTRMPRALAGLWIGAALAAAGAAVQGVIRNPLAAPDVMGITGGASVAVVAVMTLSAGGISIFWTPFIAVAGALAASGLIYVLAWKKGASPFRLVLVGIGISTAMSALTTFLLLSGPSHLASQVLNWLTGSIYGLSWDHLQTMLPWVAVTLPLLLMQARELDIHALGEELAIGLGSRLQWKRLFILLLSVLLAGIAVGFAGTLSFIGLLGPHMARRLVGYSYRFVLPASALIGGGLVMLADLAGRMLFEPLDIPAGVFTGGIGAIFFMILLFRHKA